MSDDLAGQIRRNLYAISDNYDEALEPARRANGSQVKASKEPPLPISAHILDVRLEAHRDLAFWAWFILEEMRDINGDHMHSPFKLRMTPPSPEDLIRFIVIWVDRIVETAPDDADNLAADAEKHARALAGITDPAKRDWLPIGECPVDMGVNEDGTRYVCGARVRAYPHRALITCPACGTEDTLAWWMSQIVPEGSDLAHADAVIACVVSRTFQPLTHEQLRQWATRGFILRHGKDSKGRTLYSSAAVLAYAQHQTKEEAA